MNWYNFFIVVRNAAIPAVALMLLAIVMNFDFSQPNKLGNYVLLSEDVIQEHVKTSKLWGRHAGLTCMKDGPIVLDTWSPTNKDIERLELSLNDLYELKTSTIPLSQKKRASEHYLYWLDLASSYTDIDGRLSDYFRQYIGIKVDGEEVIFINAFMKDWAEYYLEDERPYIPNPKKELVIECDAGNGAWVAVYHPKTNSYSSLVIHGRS